VLSVSQFDFAAVSKAFSFIPLKLDSKNYIFWKAQILATVRVFDLVSFLNNSSPPTKYVIDSNGGGSIVNQEVNPEYIIWLRSDQLLLGWLFSTIFEEMLAQVIYCESSAEVWLYLEKLYARQTIAKSFQLKQHLRSVKKENLSMNDYVLKIKTKSHSLAVIREPLSDNELLLAILNGLDQDYDTVVSLITYQMDDIDLEKVQYLLLMHEQHLVAKNVP